MLGNRHIVRRLISTICNQLRFVWILTIALFASNYGWAQKEKNIDDIQIVFDKSKVIVLPIEDKPITNRQQNLPVDTLKRDYSTISKDLIAPINVLDIKPKVLNYSAADEAKSKANYLKVGVGNFATSHIEGLYTHGNKEDYIVAKVLHFNNALGSQKWQASGINQLDLLGTYKALKGRIRANLLIENNRNTLFAIIPTSADSKGDIRISNLRTGFDAIYSYNKPNKYDFDLGMNLNSISSFDNQKSYFAGVFGRYGAKIDDKSGYSIRPSLAVNSIQAGPKHSVTFFDTKIDYFYRFDKLTVTPSLKLLYENDTIDKKNVHIYPSLEASYALSKRATAYGAISSDYSQNLFYNQVKENPWVSDIRQFSYLNMPLSLVVGLKGSSASWGVDVSGGLRQYKNYIVYAPSGARGDDTAKMFALNLRDTAVNISFFSVLASYRYSDNITVETGILAQGVSSSFVAKVPNIPALTWRLAPAFRFNAFTLVPTLLLYSPYNLLTTTGTKKSGTLLDISMKASYNLSHRLNMNLDIYNLSNNRTEIYSGYKQRGTLVVIGGTFKF